MKEKRTNQTTGEAPGDCSCELLVLPDGRVLVHNLTPAVADLLATLSPTDQDLLLRAVKPEPTKNELSN